MREQWEEPKRARPGKTSTDQEEEQEEQERTLLRGTQEGKLKGKINYTDKRERREETDGQAKKMEWRTERAKSKSRDDR